MAAPPTKLPLSHPINRAKLKVFLLTFLSYSVYTGTRLPYSTTKSVLVDDTRGWYPFNQHAANAQLNVTASSLHDAPQPSHGSQLLGTLDTCFLLTYALGLFISGSIGDRVNLRYFLAFGMVMSGLSTAAFGLAYYGNIHIFTYFVVCNLCAGMFQSTGWPSNVTVVSRWFGHGSRGLVLGIWNSHGSVGSVVFKVGTNLAIIYIGWYAAFTLAGLCSIVMGLLILMLLPADPRETLSAEHYQIFEVEHSGKLKHGVQVDSSDDNEAHTLMPPSASHHQIADLIDGTHHRNDSTITRVNVQPVATESSPADEDQAISFAAALRIPGVIPYSLCLAMSKFVVYSLIMWLPYYLTVACDYSLSTANNMSTIFDIGGIAGGVVAGAISDRIGMRGVTCCGMLVLSVPTILFYQVIAANGELINGAVMFFVGMLILGPYATISSAVAADLGSHPSLSGSTRAMSTVTGIIDGVGSIGGAIQGVVVSWVGAKFGWTAVMYVLMIAATMAALCLTQVVIHELQDHRRAKHSPLPTSQSDYTILRNPNGKLKDSNADIEGDGVSPRSQRLLPDEDDD